jgi:hypothetical protein
MRSLKIEDMPMLRKIALLAVIGTALASATSASAQLYGDPFAPMRPGYGRQAPPPSDYQPRERRDSQPYDRGYERPRGYDYDNGPRQRRGGGRFGDFCATSRGACRTPPQPVGSSCRCDIDGLTKRGIIQ